MGKVFGDVIGDINLWFLGDYLRKYGEEEEKND